LYWWHAPTYMLAPGAPVTPLGAVGVSAVLLAIGWVFYDQLCKRLGFAHERMLGVLLVAFLALCAWGLSHVFTGRAMFLQIGAMLGTIMAANVLYVIIPGQRQMVAAKHEGRAPDAVHGLRGKQRSVHNNYFTLPVLLAMISNHYPMTYSAPHAWLVLAALMLLAAYVRHFFNLRHRGRTVWAIPVAAAVGTLVLAIAIAPARTTPAGHVAFADVEAIIHMRCAPCHAATPTQAGITTAPKGVLLDSPAQIVANAAGIRAQAVNTHAMPLGNLTAMTDDERAKLGAWLAAGAAR
ncbi:MAG TPA: urate hydroxylase PuuD, partial [Casimicrobiaceae bacterium]|nr:urate hydroxylase PuuD [Casimicrobiaceae bacterium]